MTQNASKMFSFCFIASASLNIFEENGKIYYFRKCKFLEAQAKTEGKTAKDVFIRFNFNAKKNCRHFLPPSFSLLSHFNFVSFLFSEYFSEYLVQIHEDVHVVFNLSTPTSW